MAEAKKQRNITQFILLFLTVYIGVQLLTGVFFPSKQEGQVVSGPLLTSSSSFTIGNHPVLHLENRPASVQSFGITGWIQSKFCSLKPLVTGVSEDCEAKAVIYTGISYLSPNRCPHPPVDLFLVENPGQTNEKLTPLDSTETVIPCEPTSTVAPGASTEISLAPWKYSLFEKVAMYEARLPGTAIPTEQITGSGTVAPLPTIARFSIVEPGIFTKAFRTFITAPFLNFLILIASLSPAYSLGLAIVILTLVVKILLFFPTQHALEGQKKMQMLQPKIEALKRQYGSDAKRIQEETMKLWKEHKINPFQSCLPMLIQFPILIGLFYVIRDGTDLTLSRHLIYGPYQNLSWDFGTSFLGFDLLKPSIIILPILLVALQFFQMKLTFSIQKRKKKKQDPSLRSGQAEDSSGASSQDMQQKMMLYGLPLMIGVFAVQFPSAVSVYWGVSTLFAIGQQMIVNREHLRV